MKLQQREIRFRAWDKKHREMIEDIWIAPEYGWELFSDNDAMCERERPEREQIVLMQFTGLYDKNKKPIFEGDVLKKDWGKPSWSKQYTESLVEASWRKGSFVWIHRVCIGDTSGKALIGEPWSIDCFSQGKDLEIIGNIFENPELLDKQINI